MIKSSVNGTGINKVGKPQLLNASESLEIGMLYQIKDEVARNGNKSIYGVVDNFLFIAMTQDKTGISRKLDCFFNKIQTGAKV